MPSKGDLHCVAQRNFIPFLTVWGVACGEGRGCEFWWYQFRRLWFCEHIPVLLTRHIPPVPPYIPAADPPTCYVVLYVIKHKGYLFCHVTNGKLNLQTKPGEHPSAFTRCMHFLICYIIAIMNIG
jgi:hypothetical protein